MNVIKCKSLLREEKYDELMTELRIGLEELYIRILEHNDVIIGEKWQLPALGTKLMRIYPKFSPIIIRCENVLFSGEYTYEETIDTILDAYEYMATEYKEA